MIAPEANGLAREATIEIEQNGQLQPYRVSYDDHIEGQLSETNLIGEGGYGFVYKISLPGVENRFALKKIDKNRNNTDQNHVARALNDTLVSIRIGNQSPFLVKYFGTLDAELNFWVLTELMDTSLDKLCATMKELNIAMNGLFLSKIAKPVLLGLDFMHSRNVFHRDIKPPNILLNSDGYVKLCDFGISGFARDGVCTSYVGHDIYMAPERTQGQNVYDGKVDVWSLGITLSEIGSGINPILALAGSPANVFKISQAINDPDQELPQPDREKYGQAAIIFINRCLARDHANRPDCATLLNDEFVSQQQLGPWDAPIQQAIEMIRNARDRQS